MPAASSRMATQHCHVAANKHHSKIGSAAVALRETNKHPYDGQEQTKTMDRIQRSITLEHTTSVDQRVPESFIEAKWFLSVIYGTIIANGVVMGLSVDYIGEPYDTVWKVCDHFFTIMFTIEAICKLSVLRMRYFDDRWNKVDAALVIMAILDVWILPVVTSGDGDGDGMRTFSVLRLIKLLRVVKLIRFFKIFGQLWVLVCGIINSFQTMGWVCLLLLIFIYICAIACTSVIGHDEDNYTGYNKDHINEEFSVANWNNYQYFGTIPRSMYTLFCVVLLAEYPEIGRSVVEGQPYMILFFMGFIVITSFGIMNVIIGVIVDNTMEAAKNLEQQNEERELKRKLGMLEQIASTLFKLDSDGDRSIGIEELEEGLAANDGHLFDLIKRVNVPREFDAQDMLLLLDADGGGIISSDEFVKGFYSMMKADAFQTQCMLTVDIHRVQRTIHEQGAKLDEVKEEVQNLSALVHSLAGQGLRSEAQGLGSGAQVKEEVQKLSTLFHSLAGQGFRSEAQGSVDRWDSNMAETWKGQGQDRLENRHEQECKEKNVLSQRHLVLPSAEPDQAVGPIFEGIHPAIQVMPGKRSTSWLPPCISKSKDSQLTMSVPREFSQQEQQGSVSNQAIMSQLSLIIQHIDALDKKVTSMESRLPTTSTLEERHFKSWRVTSK